MSDKEFILVGYSGHGYVVAETALKNGVNLIGYSEKFISDRNPFDLSYLGFEKDVNFIGWSKNVSFILGIGDNTLRQNIAKLIESKGKTIHTLIHPTASISEMATIGSGTFINKNVSVNALVVVGKNVILNTGCIIEHECIISEGAHIAPGAVLAGNVVVGSGSFIGANAVVKQGVNIGNNVVIGAGAVVIRNVLDNKTVAGNPATEIV